jgi:Rrf2 family protein
MMRISMKTDYGLIALKHMAAQKGNGLVNAKELATRFQLPPNLLAKILQSLSQSGIIEAQKGSGGGYRIARDPKDITLTEIFESIEGPVHMIMCTSDNGNCSVEDSCTIRNGLITLERKFADFFDSITLADI